MLSRKSKGGIDCLLHCSLYQLHWAATGNRYCFVNTAYYCCQSEIFSEFLFCKTLVQSETKFQKTTVPVKCKSRVWGCSSWSLVDQISSHFIVIKNFWTSALCFAFSLARASVSLCQIQMLSFQSRMRAETSVSYWKETTLTLNLAT